MQTGCVRVGGGVYDVEMRLKEIDSGYFLVRNTMRNRFEVHHSAQAYSTLALVVPYGALDARTVALVQRTRIQRMEEEIRAMDAHNDAAEKCHRRRIEEAVLRKAYG